MQCSLCHGSECVPGALHTPVLGTFSLPWPPLPSFFCLKGEPILQGLLGAEPRESPAIFSMHSPCPACSLECSAIPSFLELHWPCCHPHPGLHHFFFFFGLFEHDWFDGVASCFLLCLQENFKLIYGTYPQELTYLDALSAPNSWPPSFPPLSFMTMAALSPFPKGFSNDSAGKDHRCVFSLEIMFK